jgi:hypothetical protein
MMNELADNMPNLSDTYSIFGLSLGPAKTEISLKQLETAHRKSIQGRISEEFN